METNGVVALAREAMRTRFEVVIPGVDPDGRLYAAAEEALEEIGRVEADLSPYRSDSIFFHLNAEAADVPVLVDPALFALLERAGALTEKLEGAFDLTVGALVQHWRGASARSLEEARGLVGFGARVWLDGEARTVAFDRPGVRLDPGALGKGYALERAAALLVEGGVTCALLHGGTSSVRALGRPAGHEGWTIALQHPTTAHERLARVRLVDRALSVSAISGRAFERDGQRVGHVVDPRSGLPVSHTALAAVVTRDATEAEAISTALLVLGAEGLDLVEREFPGAEAFVASPREDGRLQIDVLGDAFFEA
jgi:thiamine biosynthesis lipoprotein